MRYWISAIILAGILVEVAFAAGKGPEITIIDDKLSISADTIPIGRLFRLLDQATGMQSKVPREFADRNISVRFSGLSFDDGVRKIFQGQPFDYVVISGQGIVITAASQTLSASESAAPAVNSQPQSLDQPLAQDDQPFIPPQQLPPVGIQPAPGAPFVGGVANNPFNPQPQQQQPAVIQTPFGPIANPRANQGLQNNGTVPVFGANSPQSPGQTGFGAPFGANSTFGNTNPPGSSPSTIFQNPNPQGTASPGGLFPNQASQPRP